MDVSISKKPLAVADRPGWYYKQDGRRLSLDTQDKAEASRRLNALRRLYFEGKLTHITGDCGKTLGEYVDEYLFWSIENRPKSTHRADKLALGKLTAEAGRNVRLDRLGPKEADAVVTSCRRAKNKPGSINNYIRHLRAAFNKAVEWKYLKANPFRGVKEVSKDRTPPSFATRLDIGRLLKTIEDLDLRRMVAAYLSTGRRRAELLALCWEDVRIAEGKYLVRKSKTHLCRWYPLNDAFRSVLVSMGGEGQGRIFFRWLHPDTISHAVKDALKVAGLGHLRLHDLRHSFAVMFLEAGGSLPALQDLLGHTEARTTEIYAHLSADHMKAEVNRVKLGPIDLGFGSR